mmetsp:Transcript_22928/g.32865  ORF Transcript_22928/g.32865 Transcript_22928/m.32865 type:complete len:389 (-) Transcript_22928:479-1645(-)
MAILYPKINKDNLFGPGSPVSVINQWFHSQKMYGIHKNEDLPWLSLPTLLGGSPRVREQLTSKLNETAGATKELGAPTKSNRKIRNQETSRKLEKDSYVIDALYHCRTSFLRHGNPLGFECESFEDTLAKVCQSSQQQPSLGPLSQRIRLEIALLMRGSDDMSHFTFWPTHKLFKTDGCMIIQKKVFRIQAGTAKVTALSTDDAYDKAFREKRQNHNNDRIIIVHELIFGPAFMHAVTQPALYFDLHQDDLIAFPQEDQKKFVNSLQKSSEKNPLRPSDPEAIAKKWRQLSRPPFHIVRPIDKDAFQLVTTLMNHRLSQLRSPWFRILANQWLIPPGGWWENLTETMTTNKQCHYSTIHRFDPPTEHMGGQGKAGSYLGNIYPNVASR